jgi:hypothetical protein
MRWRGTLSPSDYAGKDARRFLENILTLECPEDTAISVTSQTAQPTYLKAMFGEGIAESRTGAAVFDSTS